MYGSSTVSNLDKDYKKGRIIAFCNVKILLNNDTLKIT